MRSRLRPARVSLPGPVDLRYVELDDGTGDRLAVWLHEPERVTHDTGVLLVHGLGGTADSDYIVASAAGLVESGFRVARVDLRGVGESSGVSTSLYHGGRTEDIRAVLGWLHAELGWQQVAPIGYSLGGNAVLKLLGEPFEGIPVVAGASVSAPLDLTVGGDHLAGAAWGGYERFLMRRIRRDSLRPGARYTPEERRLILASRTLAEFDDAVTAPRNGWRDSMEYYEVNSSILFLEQIRVPTLVIHSMDDPMIPPEPYRRVDWDRLEAGGCIRREITDVGGHVGFHERDSRLPWFVGRLREFLHLS